MKEVSHIVHGRRVTFKCPNELCEARAATLWTKEPGTIAWLETFRAGDVFWDIGANVGCYSLYAAALGARVYAFEPVTANCAVLNANIRASGMCEEITALSVAVASRSRVAHMAMRDGVTGSAHHHFDGSKADWKQGALSVSMEALHTLFGLEWPDHIKIDVDGNELDILSGGSLILARAKSVMIEVDLRDEKRLALIRSELESAGLREDKSILQNVPRPGGVFNLHYSR